MWIWDWFVSLSSEGKALIVTIAGVAVKWWMDRRFIAGLRGEIATKEAELTEKEKRLRATEARLQEAQKKLDDLRQALQEIETGLWTTFPRRQPFTDFDARIGRRNPIILTIANNKGGVGKTTLVGNLLAYFERNRELRALALDMDYQGSLTTMLQRHSGPVLPGAPDVNALLQPGADVATLLTIMHGLGKQLPRSHYVSALYELALSEDRLMIEWLLQEHDGDDVRYRLASVLLQPQIQQRFDIILIDVPPRLTTGTINALCTSTHILVPAIFNPIAAEPVPNFLGNAIGLMHQLNPAASFIGVVETMAPPPTQGQEAREAGRLIVQEALDRSFPNISILKSVVPRRVPIAEGGVAYLVDASARAIFDELGDEISQRIGL